MSINIFNRDDGNKQSRYAQIDRNFDAYWEHEARNPNRNRIRIGRQYQATVPPLLKSSQSDDRRLSELETLRWSPAHNHLPDPQLQQYVKVARMLSQMDRPQLLANLIHNSNQTTNQTTETNQSNDSSSGTSDVSSNNNNNNSSNSTDKTNNNSTSENGNKSKSSSKTTSAELSLARLIAAHHSNQMQNNCKLTQMKSDTEMEDEKETCLSASTFANWTTTETALFSQALAICGKNLALIRQHFLPWKSAQSLLDAYYSILNQAKQSSSNLDNSDLDAFATFYGRPARLENVPENNLTSQIGELSKSEHLTKDNLGSLKFYKDGQLVLKLDAKKPIIDQRCQWTEAADSVSRLRPANHNSNSSIRRKRLEQSRAKANADDPDECRSNDSTNEEDSLDSADTCLLPSTCLQPPAKRTRIRVENNCQVPIGTAEDDPAMVRKEMHSPYSPDFVPMNDLSDSKRKQRLIDLSKCSNLPATSVPSQMSSIGFEENQALERSFTAASLALDLTRKLASAHPLAAALAETAQLLPTSTNPTTLPQCKLFGTNSFEPIDFSIGSNSTPNSAAPLFLPAALLNLIKGVDSK